jgi:photosystem II stability/assembly factor-like uncharacterized protein
MATGKKWPFFLLFINTCNFISIPMLFAQGSWRQVRRTDCSEWLSSVQFSDKLHGWITGSSQVLYTDDGGTTWTGIDSIAASCIFFVDRDRGWYLGAEGIYHTDNGGHKWRFQYPVEKCRLLFFCDKAHGWIVTMDSSGSDFWNTSDGGSSWHLQSHLIYGIRKIFFEDSLEGWAVGDCQVIYHTQDGGIKWYKQHQGSDIYSSFWDVFFIDNKKGWAVGGDLCIWHTVDGGIRWVAEQCQYDFESGGPNAVYFINADNGWIGGYYEYMLHTKDGGISWEKVYAPAGGFLCSNLYFVDLDHGWAVGTCGSIYKWEGTRTVSYSSGQKIPQCLSLFPCYPNPFSPRERGQSAVIQYSLPQKSNVSIKIFTILGQLVRTFQQETKLSGLHQVCWDGCNNLGEIVADGTYLFQIQAGEEIKVGKLAVVK